MEFILKHKQRVLVDDSDFEWLSKYRWHGGRYATTIINGKQQSMHRIIMQCTDPKLRVDHINHNTLDNRRSNLRVCTNAENVTNRRPKKNGTSEYLGVSFDKKRKKWAAQITTKKRTYYLGRFDTELEAARVYDAAAVKAHGQFANPNNV